MRSHPDLAPGPGGANTMSIGLATLAAALSGLLYALAFPPPGLAWLAWIGLAPFFAALWQARLRRALLLGVVWTAVATYGVGSCLPGAVVEYYRQPAALGWLLLLLVMLVTAIPWYALFALAFARLSRFHARGLPLLAGAAWAAAEMGRIRGLVGNPWGVSGYSQVPVLPIAQVADLTGVLGLSFLIGATNAAFAQLWVSRASAGLRRDARIGAGGVAGILSLALLYGALRLQQWPRAAAANPTRVAVIQPNLDLGSAWMSELYGRNLRKYLELTYEAAKATRADLVVWPETAMTFYVAYEPAYRASLAQVLEPADIELIAGGVHYLGEAHDRRFYNSTFLIEPSGEVKGRYDKLRLLPFAEYFPSTLLDFARRDFGEVREFAPGNPTSPLVTRAGTAGVLVCNEAFFGQLAAERVETGATLLVNPSNDSWMGDPSYALQAFQISRLRAIEQRRYLVRTSTSGPSAIVDPGGRVLEATDPDTRGWIAGEVSPQSERTVYQRVGDAFGLACLAAVVLAILPLAWRSDR